MERSLSKGSVDDPMCDLAASSASSRNSSASVPADSLDLRSRAGNLGSSGPIRLSMESRVREASSRLPDSRASECLSKSRTREASSLSYDSKSDRFTESAPDRRV